MLAGFLSVIIRSVDQQGGVGPIISDSEQGGRLNFWEWVCVTRWESATEACWQSCCPAATVQQSLQNRWNQNNPFKKYHESFFQSVGLCMSMVFLIVPLALTQTLWGDTLSGPLVSVGPSSGPVSTGSTRLRFRGTSPVRASLMPGCKYWDLLSPHRDISYISLKILVPFPRFCLQSSLHQPLRTGVHLAVLSVCRNVSLLRL